MSGQDRGNAFDFLRIAAALTVLVGHSFAFLGLPEPNLPYGESIGTLAVRVFFVISGYLIMASWQRDSDWARFLFRRVIRIFPGLVVATLVVVVLIGPLATRLDVREYFERGEIWRHFFHVVSLRSSAGLPGVFTENPFPLEVNGSLWSVRYEVVMYLVLAALGLMLRRYGKFTLGASCGLVIAVAVVLHVYAALSGVARVQIPFLWRFDPAAIGYDFDLLRLVGLAAFFFGGWVLYLFAERIPLSWSVCAILCALTVWLPSSQWRYCIAWLAIPYTCIVFAHRAPRILRGWGGYDYSYGIYIYAFPLQQLLVHWYWPKFSHSLILAASVVVTIAFAALSWHFVEKPAMRLKPASRQARQ